MNLQRSNRIKFGILLPDQTQRTQIDLDLIRNYPQIRLL